ASGRDGAARRHRAPRGRCAPLRGPRGGCRGARGSDPAAGSRSGGGRLGRPGAVERPRARARRPDGLRPRRKAMAMIRIRNLEKSVRSGTGQLFLLRNVNLVVEKGDFLTLMGPSGAGKSTLLAVMGMLDADWTGEFELDGQRVDRMSPRDRQALARSHVGFVFQRYHLLDDLTVAENLEVPLGYRGFSRKEIQA